MEKETAFIQSEDDVPQYLEYNIPMVSSDGEPHKVLTMIAVCSGLVVAIIVLLILIVLIDCQRRNYTTEQQRNDDGGGSSNEKNNKLNNDSLKKTSKNKSSSIFTIFKGKQIDGIASDNYGYNDNENCSYSRTVSIEHPAISTIIDETRPTTMNSISETIFINKLPGISTVSC